MVEMQDAEGEAEGNAADWFSPRPEEGASEWLRCKAPRVRAQILARAYATGTGIGGGLPEAEGNEADWFSSRPEEGGVRMIEMQGAEGEGEGNEAD